MNLYQPENLSIAYCSKCKDYLPKDKFYVCKRNPNGVQWTCKSCMAQTKREWIDLHRPKQVDSKVCITCKTDKKSEEFPFRKASADHLNPNCTECCKKKWESQKYIQAAYRREKYYGLTDDEYKKMLAEQDEKCKICKLTPKVLVVDHDHVTEKVRGLLCSKCNSGIGYFKDDIAMVQSALNYLTLYKES